MWSRLAEQLRHFSTLKALIFLCNSLSNVNHLVTAKSKSKSIKQVVREWAMGSTFSTCSLFLKLVIFVCGEIDDEFRDKTKRQLDNSFSLKDVRSIHSQFQLSWSNPLAFGRHYPRCSNFFV